MTKIVTAEEAISNICDQDVMVIGGAGAGHAVPDKILKALGERYVKQSTPKNLTIIHPCGIGDNDKRGLNHLAHEGLIEVNIGGFWGNAPKLVELAKLEKIKGYNFPQGVLCHLVRASAARRPGIVTKVGLGTFVDPEVEGGCINKITPKDYVHKINFQEEEYLFYKTIPIDVAIIRGTSIDRDGNLTMEEEVGSFTMLSLAQAAKVNNGLVIAQVKKKFNGHKCPSNVKVPGSLIDYVVLDENQEMTFLSNYDSSLISRDEISPNPEPPLKGIKRVVSRRAALELEPDKYVNLGYGMSDGIPLVAAEEKVENDLTFMIEQGSSGGLPATGLNFGAMYNPSAIIDDAYQFDFFHGGGLDIAFLGFAQIDENGNVNSSRFGEHITGCGGFIDISQNAKKVVFCGSFSVKSEIDFAYNGLIIKHPGKKNKFVKQVQQITFNGQYALEKGQEVIYVTERAVFKLTQKGLLLQELASGVDLVRDVLEKMDFTPIVPSKITYFNSKVFDKKSLGLKEKFKHIWKEKAGFTVS